MSACLWSVLSVVVFVVVATIWDGIRLRRVVAERAGETFANFCVMFGADGVPESVLRAVFEKCQQWCAGTVHEFPARASDDIEGMFGVIDDDLEEAVISVLATCGRQLPPEPHLLRLPPIVTVRDFVRFVAACPEIASD